MKTEVNYVKPSRTRRCMEVVTGVVSVAFVKRTALLFAYYVVNYVNGYRQCKKGSHVNIHPTVILRHPENIEIGSGAFLNHNNVLQAGKMHAKIRIGDHVMTGPNVMMFAYNHGTELNGVPMIQQPYSEKDIIIEKDVWIGAGSIILAGTHIGEGAVIAAGSIVRGRIGAFEIYAGHLARRIRRREGEHNELGSAAPRAGK